MRFKFKRNILIFNSRLKVTDFGLSKIIDNKTMTTKLGTDGYKSPEMQHGHNIDEKTDIWFYFINGDN